MCGETFSVLGNGISCKFKFSCFGSSALTGSGKASFVGFFSFFFFFLSFCAFVVLGRLALEETGSRAPHVLQICSPAS